MKKNQNRITEYRKMFQGWKNAGMITYAGFILGLPGDTPASVKRDIEIIQKELPVDLLEFTMLTPLPGSEDHQKLHEKGVWMDPDLNKYDLETATVEHPRMSRQEWQQTYWDAWNWYYSDEHVERMMRRNLAYGINPVRLLRGVLQIYGAMNFEGVHPQQCGYLRRKDRTQRRPELPRVPALIFYPTPRLFSRWRNMRSSGFMRSRASGCAIASRGTRSRRPIPISRSRLSSTPRTKRSRCSRSTIRRARRSPRLALRPSVAGKARSRRSAYRIGLRASRRERRRPSPASLGHPEDAFSERPLSRASRRFIRADL